MQNVRDFGAIGDGIANDTKAFQRALDTAGEVFVPQGVYRIGTIYLRSNGGLDLATDAILLASSDREDYNAPDFCPQNHVSILEKASGTHLIVALECENVFLRGMGKINGNREAFFDPTNTTRKDFTGWRPSQMLFFCESKNVQIRDVTLVQSPYWSCFIFGCSYVNITGVKISNTPKKAWNGDGIDIDASDNVTISNCIIRSSDDCLTIRAAGEGKLQKHPNICENIVITNCILMDGHCAVRFGVGTGIIRNCAVSNCSIKDTWYGLGVHSTYMPNLFTASAAGCSVENILFSNIIMNCSCPFYVAPNEAMGPLPSSLREVKGIQFSNIRAKGRRNCLIEGNQDYNMSDVIFSDVTIEMSAGEDIIQTAPPEMRTGCGAYHYPHALHIDYAKDFIFRNFTIRWNNASENWKSAVYISNSTDLKFQDCRFFPPKDGIDIVNG